MEKRWRFGSREAQDGGTRRKEGTKQKGGGGEVCVKRREMLTRRKCQEEHLGGKHPEEFRHGLARNACECCKRGVNFLPPINLNNVVGIKKELQPPIGPLKAPPEKRSPKGTRGASTSSEGIEAIWCKKKKPPQKKEDTKKMQLK